LTYFFQINLNLSHLNQFKKQMVWDQKNVGVPLNVLNYGKIIICLLCVGFKQLNKYMYIYIPKTRLFNNNNNTQIFFQFQNK